MKPKRELNIKIRDLLAAYEDRQRCRADIDALERQIEWRVA